MAGMGNSARTGRRVGHSLCPLESCNEGELCPHAMHMALRMEDGVEADAPNSRGGCRRGMERREPAQQRTESPLVGRKGVPEAGESFGVSSTRLAPSMKENSSDPKMICTITHHTILINNIRVEHRHGGCGTQWCRSLPRAGAIVKQR